MQNRPNPPRKRPMSKKQLEAIKRKRRQQNVRAIAILGGIAMVIIAVVVMILTPRAPVDVPVAVEAVETPEATAESTPEPSSTPVPELPEAIEEVGETVPLGTGLRSVRMRVVGDIMMSMDQIGYAMISGYDFHNQFEQVAYLLRNADYTMGNMEGTIGKFKNMDYSGYPMFNCPEAVLQAIKDSGIDFLTLANNHMLDRYFDGLKNTVNWVEQYGLAHAGAFRTQEEHDTPIVINIGGIRFGFVAYTQLTNNMENASSAKGVAIGVPYLFKSKIKSDIQKLREAGAEVVIAFPHWGTEYVREPDEDQTLYARRLAQYGADIIIGSHSHMVQPMGYQEVTDDDGKTRKVFTVFSMGNFISDHTMQYTDNGIILDFTVNEHPDGTFSCDNVGYIPIFTWKQNAAFTVLPTGKSIRERPEGMSDENYDRMVQGYYEIIEMVGDEFQLITG